MKPLMNAFLLLSLVGGSLNAANASSVPGEMKSSQDYMEYYLNDSADTLIETIRQYSLRPASQRHPQELVGLLRALGQKLAAYETKGISFEHRNLKDEGIMLLFNTLNTSPANVTLKWQELFLHDNNIGPTGAGIIARAIRHMPDLTNVNIARNPDLGATGVSLLAKALSTLEGLATLNFSNCNMGDEGAIALAEALKNGMAPKRNDLRLTLSGNNITSKGAKALAEVLKVRKIPFLKLDISGNQFNENDEGGKALKDLKQDTPYATIEF